MDVKTVCLGLLSFGEATGYDLKKHFEASFDHFFSTGFGSIYPALSALAGEGLAECTSVPQEGRPDRKIYRITPAGEAALRTTLATCEPGHKLRSELLALLYFSNLVPPERVKSLLDSRLAQMVGEYLGQSGFAFSHAPDARTGQPMQLVHRMRMSLMMRARAFLSLF